MIKLFIAGAESLTSMRYLMTSSGSTSNLKGVMFISDSELSGIQPCPMLFPTDRIDWVLDARHALRLYATPDECFGGSCAQLG